MERAHLINNSNKMKLDYINSWRKGNKRVWVGNIKFRVGRITLFELAWDFKLRFLRLMVLNFGAELMY